MATQMQTTEQLSTQVPALTAEGERFALRQRMARMFASSPLVPEHLRKGSVEQAIANCWIALTLAEAMGEVPLIVMQNIHVVNGKAGFAAQYMIARANNSGIFKGRIDWRIERDDPANLAVTAYATVKESGQQVEVTCDMKMAKAEGWTKNPKYGTMPEVMLRYRSAAFLVRFYAPDVMLGYQTVEENEDVYASAAPSTPRLTGDMLIEQSQPPTLTATPLPAHDEVTGELVEEEAAAEHAGEADTPQETPAEQQPEPEQRGEEAATDDDSPDAPHPAQAKAEEIIGRTKTVTLMVDLKKLEKEIELDVSLMPEYLASAIEAALDEARARLKPAVHPSLAEPVR